MVSIFIKKIEKIEDMTNCVLVLLGHVYLGHVVFM
jgi:hypothetical protein